MCLSIWARDGRTLEEARRQQGGWAAPGCATRAGALWTARNPRKRIRPRRPPSRSRPRSTCVGPGGIRIWLNGPNPVVRCQTVTQLLQSGTQVSTPTNQHSFKTMSMGTDQLKKLNSFRIRTICESFLIQGCYHYYSIWTVSSRILCCVFWWKHGIPNLDRTLKLIKNLTNRRILSKKIVNWSVKYRDDAQICVNYHVSTNLYFKWSSAHVNAPLPCHGCKAPLPHIH